MLTWLYVIARIGDAGDIGLNVANHYHGIAVKTIGMEIP
jgi:hypothetical protein